MKIIDFEVRGNAVRFALGADDCDDYWGDDWDDAPYEHNAGPVYDRYVKGYATIFFPFDYRVLTPESDWHYAGNSPFSKERFKKEKIPFLVVDKETDRYYSDLSYSTSALKADTKKFYFEDSFDPPGIYQFDAEGNLWLIDN